jgi:hypothetical protein
MTSRNGSLSNWDKRFEMPTIAREAKQDAHVFPLIFILAGATARQPTILDATRSGTQSRSCSPFNTIPVCSIARTQDRSEHIVSMWRSEGGAKERCIPLQSGKRLFGDVVCCKQHRRFTTTKTKRGCAAFPAQCEED